MQLLGDPDTLHVDIVKFPARLREDKSYGEEHLKEGAKSVNSLHKDPFLGLLLILNLQISMIALAPQGQKLIKWPWLAVIEDGDLALCQKEQTSIDSL